MSLGDRRWSPRRRRSLWLGQHYRSGGLTFHRMIDLELFPFRAEGGLCVDGAGTREAVDA